MTLFAFVVRVLRLDYVNLHSDEAFFIQIAYQGSFMGSLGFNEPHPPLFLAMLQAWMGPAGVSAFAIRLLPVLYGTLLAPLTWQLGRLIGSRRLGLAGAFVAAANPVFIFYAKEVRNNGLMAVTGALSLVLLLLAVRRPRLLPAYVVAALAALYSHYYDAAIVALELALAGVWLLRRPKVRRWPWAAAALALAAGFVPWLAYARSTIANYDAGRGALGVFWANLVETYQAFNFGFSVRPQDLLWPTVGVAGLGLLGIAGALAIRRGALGVIAAYGLAPVAFGALTLLHQTNFNPRYLFAGAPAYALLLGAGLALLLRWHWSAAAVGCAFLLGLTGYTIRNTDFIPEFQPNGYREMVTYLSSHASAGQAMVLDGVSQWPLYFYYGELQAHLPQRVEFLPRETPEASHQTVDELLAAGGVWYLETDLLRYDPTHDTERRLAASGYQVSDRHFAGQRLEYFAGAASGPVQPASAEAGGMRLTAATRPDRPVSAGQPLGVELDWQRTGEVRPFKLSLRLDGPDGTAAQNDTLPGGGYVDFAVWAPNAPLRERAGLMAPIGLTPGAYTLHALAYDDAAQPLGPPIDLGPVTVDHAAPQNPAASELLPIGVDLSSTGAKTAGAAARSSPAAGGAISASATRGAGNAGVGTGAPDSISSAAGGAAAPRPIAEGASVLRLEAAGTPTAGLTPGDRAPITLLWSGGRTAEARHVRVAVGAAAEDHLVGGERYPTTAWTAQDVVRDVVRFRVPPSMAAGEYPVTVDGVRVGSLRVLPVERSFSPPPLAHSVGARFGDVAQLLGYDAQPAAGGLHVQLTWQALADGDASYTAFVHALTPDGAVASQADLPAGTDRWVKGQVVTTTYDLASPPPDFRLEVGLYDPASGKRLPVGGGRDSVLLPA